MRNGEGSLVKAKFEKTGNTLNPSPTQCFAGAGSILRTVRSLPIDVDAIVVVLEGLGMGPTVCAWVVGQHTVRRELRSKIVHEGREEETRSLTRLDRGTYSESAKMQRNRLGIHHGRLLL